ncbi:MAG: hypothetical protein P1Q69_15805 [Candidatus Thorarchaeota archaeon]|nr:hypothetical protein [Candidatus Thorarchaeota archaeon]
MSESFKTEDLVDRLLLIVALNSTLVHFLISSQVEGYVDPDRVDSLAQGLIKTRSWIEEATTAEGIPDSTTNILSLIVKRLTQIESILPKLSEKAKQAEKSGSPAAEILSLLEGESKATTPRTTTATSSGLTSQGGDPSIVPLVTDEPEVPTEPFKKVDMENDEWGIIGQTQRLIEQYSKRCHVLLPTFWSEVIREIHKYQSHSQYIGDVIEIPSKVLAKTVKGLLTEAPGARLLQDLSKRRAQETYLDASEAERIQRAVAKYFQGLEGVLTENLPDGKEKIAEAKGAFDGFGWGGPELEKRLIKRINQQSEEAIQDAEASTDPARAAIYSELAKLLCKLQHAILAEPRLRQILADIKP